MNYAEWMRTTVKLDDDVAAAVEQLKSSENLGFSEALNKLARAGVTVVGQGATRRPMVLPTFDMGAMLDVSNVAEALEFLETHDDR